MHFGFSTWNCSYYSKYKFEYYSAEAEPIKCDCCSLRVLLREFDCHLTKQSKIIVSITKKGALVCCFFGRGRLSDKVYGSDMFTVSRSRSLVASTDVAFIQWLFLSQHRVQIYCSAAGITGWEREMKGKGVITRLSTRVRLPFSTISALVP